MHQIHHSRNDVDNGASGDDRVETDLSRRRAIARLGGLLVAVHSARAYSACDTSFSPRPELEPNTFDEITRYNNYYEFSSNKEAVHVLAQSLTTDPWSVQIDGEVENPLVLDVDQITQRFDVEERVHSLRCVEGWSKVVPWSGFPLCKLIKSARPLSHARFVQFESLYRPAEMIGQRTRNFPWPYTEALTLEEALHPLAFVATGLYGRPLPKQNGAPLRLVMPWKYGFKSIKAITRIRLTRSRPETSWSKQVPSEYGFFGNVNPAVAHPRWNQKREHRLGELRKRKTVLFNGYADEVANLYQGLDLRRNF